MGGTLLSAAIPYLVAKGDETINAATFFVALKDFTDVGDISVFIDEPQLTNMEGEMAERGYLDSPSMATMFNMLRANDLIWSNVVNNSIQSPHEGTRLLDQRQTSEKCRPMV